MYLCYIDFCGVKVFPVVVAKPNTVYLLGDFCLNINGNSYFQLSHFLKRLGNFMNLGTGIQPKYVFLDSWIPRFSGRTNHSYQSSNFNCLGPQIKSPCPSLAENVCLKTFPKKRPCIQPPNAGNSQDVVLLLLEFC